MNIKRGFFHAQLGWQFYNSAPVLKKEVDVSDVQKDSLANLQSTLYLLFAPLMAFVLPAAIASTWDDLMVQLIWKCYTHITSREVFYTLV